jgi:hypothetical protein
VRGAASVAISVDMFKIVAWDMLKPL